MRILVCFKAVPVWEKILDSDWEDFSPDADITYAGTAVNCFDESALELALRLREQLDAEGGRTRLAALSAGKVSPAIVTALYAAGFDDVAIIPCGDIEFNPKKTAEILADFIEDEGFDLILTGIEAGMADTGLVPRFLSLLLDIPLISNAGELDAAAFSTPAVVSVGNSPAVLRATGLRARLQAKEKKARIIPPKERAACSPPHIELLRPDRGRSCVLWDADTPSVAAERILKALSEGGCTEKAANTPLVPELSEEMAGKIRLLPDTEKGRRELVRLALKEGRSYFTGAEIECIDKGGLTLRKSVCASNCQWRARLNLPAAVVLSGWRPGECGGNARTAIICGTGVGSREVCDRARALAEKLGADFALTRPAALCGWGKPEEIAGQSGRSLSPECCLVLGASGAGAFLAGIKGAGRIIAVNTDPKALIFKNADIGLAADAPALINALSDALNAKE